MDQRQWLKNIEAWRERERKRQEKAEREFWKHPYTVSTLEECLQRLTKYDLDEIRKFYNFRGVSHLNKQDLIHVLSEGVPSLFGKRLSILKEEQYNLIQEMVQNGGRTGAEGYS
ncbi:hypothetical protein EQV77_09420 [Halobacillus fulvus]|nr:hypothetical protein EQV77_09420 [Halobacillus fulvus]